MIKVLVTDFSRVLLFPKDRNYDGSLNALFKQVTKRRDFEFFKYFELNTELLDFYDSLKDTVDLYIFTSDSIQDDVELRPYLLPVFKDIFSAKKLGFTKDDPSAYKLIAHKLNTDSSEILYIDDSEQNIVAAQQSNLTTLMYENNSNTIKNTSKMII